MVNESRVRVLGKSVSRFATERDTVERSGLRIALPSRDARFEQDDEWCVVQVNGAWREIRFHDYGQIYEIPGLYEHLFHGLLKCTSPRVIRDLLQEEIRSVPSERRRLHVLDLGAGNGLVGEELSDMGASRIVGVDICSEAASATRRDRPGIYEEYLQLDMTRLTQRQREQLMRFDFNCLTCVAALGFGDIPPLAFAEAYNFIASGGLVAFNLKEDFLQDGEPTGFAQLIDGMISEGALAIRRKERYRHRLATNRDAIFYVAFVGTKNRDVEIPTA